MRRLLWQLSALLLAWMAWRALPAAGAVALWQVRDLLLAALAAGGLAAWQALAPPWNDRDARAWPALGRALFGGGAAVAIFAGGVNVAALAGAPVEPLIPVVWSVGVGVLLLGALLRGPITRYAAPAFRWVRDRQGTLVRRPAVDDRDALAGHLEWDWLPLLLTAIILAGVALRIVPALRGPAVCAPAECLLLSDVTTLRATLLLDPLLRLFEGLGHPSLVALRLALATVASLLLPALAWALAALATPAGVLLGVSLAAFSLWPPLSGAAASPWIEASLLLLVATGGILRGLRPNAGASANAVAGLAVGGLALGLLAVVAREAALLWLLWSVGLLALVIWKRPGAPTLALVLLASALAGAALADLPQGVLLAPLTNGLPARDGFLALGLLASEVAQGAGALLAAAAVVGAGALLRARRRGAALLAGAGLTLLLLLRVGATGLSTAGVQTDPALALLAPWLLIGAGYAADQVVRALLVAWQPSATRGLAPGPVVLVAAVALMLIQTPALLGALRQETLALANGSDREALAAAAFVTTLAETNAQPVVLVPPALLDHPALRVAAANPATSARLTSWSAANIPFAAEAPGGLVYLVPPTETATLEWLRAAYPAGITQPVASGAADPFASPLNGVPASFDALGEAPALLTFSVPPAAVAASFGLSQFLWPGSEWGPAEDAIVSVSSGPLQFNWEDAPPLDAPFSAEWTGSLLVPETGLYTFSAQVAPDALLSFQLDRLLILDTSAGLAEWSERLLAGAYAVTLRYRSGAQPADVALLWQRTGQGEAQPLPLTALHNPALPMQGLLATKTAGSTWDGDLLDQRKDPLLAPPVAGTGEPISMVWQGQIGIPRAGEYLIGVQADDSVVVSLAGQTLIERTGPVNLEAPQPTEGSIYLERGWLPISIRTVHTGQTVPTLALYWQAPGTGPQTLGPGQLVPLVGPLAEADLPLPALSPADAQLGDETFALSRDPGIWQPARRIPPAALPQLLLERQWTVGGACGAGEGQFNSPRGLALNAETGVLYVADAGNRRVIALALDGSGFTALPLDGLEEPVDVAVLPGGDLLVLDNAAPRLVRYTPATGARTDIALAEGFYRPRGLSVDATGQIYLADTGGARIAAVDEAGGLLAEFGGPGTTIGAGQPVDVVAAPGGAGLWAVTAQDGRLWHLDVQGSLTALLPTDTIVGPHLAAVDLGAAGPRLLLSDPARQQVLLLSAAGQPLGALAETGAFLRPTGVAAWPVNAGITLAVADAEACSVSAWVGVVE